MKAFTRIASAVVVTLLVFAGCASQEAGATPPASSSDASSVVIQGNGAKLCGPDATCYDARYLSVPTGSVASEVHFQNGGGVVFSVHRIEQNGLVTLVGTVAPASSVSMTNERVGNFFAFRDEDGYDFAYYRVRVEVTQTVTVLR